VVVPAKATAKAKKAKAKAAATAGEAEVARAREDRARGARDGAGETEAAAASRRKGKESDLVERLIVKVDAINRLPTRLMARRAPAAVDPQGSSLLRLVVDGLENALSERRHLA